MSIPDPKIYWVEDEARHKVRELNRELERNGLIRARKLPWWTPLVIFGVMIAGALLAIILIEVLL